MPRGRRPHTNSATGGPSGPPVVVRRPGRYRLPRRVGADAQETGSGRGRDATDMGVAMLLAAAAVVAALIGGRAALLGDSGSDAYSEAVRADVRQGARIVGDARRLYEEDASVAHRIAEAQLLGEALGREARSEEGLPSSILQAEAEASATVADVLAGPSKLADGSARAATELTGEDILDRFAEIRAERSAELAAVDPDGIAEEAGEESDAATAMAAAAIPLGIAFLFGALAEAFANRRRLFVIAGWSALAIGVAIAIIVELGI